MPMSITGLVNKVPNVSLPTGTNTAPFMQGGSAELITNELAGRYYSQLVSGNIWIGSTAAAGTAIPLSNATSLTFSLWNPAGSGKNIIPIAYLAGVATVGTPAVTALGLSYSTGMGSQIGTGSPVSALTALTPTNGLLGNGSGQQTVAKLASAATVASAVTWLMNLGWSQESTTAQNGFTQLQYLFDGTLALAPGSLVATTGVAAPGQTITQTLIWLEMPVVS